MNKERIRHDRSAEGVGKALKELVGDKPELDGIVKAFGPFLIAKAVFKEACKLNEDSEKEPFFPDQISLDGERFSQGEPLFTSVGLIDFHDDFKNGAKVLLPPMKNALVGICDDLEKIEKGFASNAIDARESVQAFVDDDAKVLEELAKKVEVSSQVIKFVMGQLVKPFMEMQSELFAPLTEGLQWLHGYCPICGSHAAISGLVGEGGKRWLQCSMCSHEWRFNRHTCPKCKNADHTKHDYFFDEKSVVKAGERVDVCHECDSYLLTVDLRERIDPVNMEVQTMRMIPLDIIAQQKGYTPIAATPWNSLK